MDYVVEFFRGDKFRITGDQRAALLSAWNHPGAKFCVIGNTTIVFSNIAKISGIKADFLPDTLLAEKTEGKQVSKHIIEELKAHLSKRFSWK